MTCEIAGKRLFLCDCSKSMRLDKEKLGKMLHVTEDFNIYHQLCSKELCEFENGISESDAIIACTQEESVFRSLAEDINSDSKFVHINIREHAAWGEEGENAGPKITALLEGAALEVAPPDGVTMKSEGRTLVYGRGDVVLDAARQLAHRLDVTLLIDQPDNMFPPSAPNFKIVGGRIQESSGYLGAFHIGVQDLSAKDPSARSTISFGPSATELTNLQFDLILDLAGGPPLFEGDDRRDGYFRVEPGAPIKIQQALFELVDMVGTFDKPRYISQEQDLCVHGRNRQVGCTRCLDHCPTASITPIDDVVSVNEYTCAGCGQCASVCPTGSLSYTVPFPSNQCDVFRTLLGKYHEAGGRHPILLLYDDNMAEELLAIGRFGRGFPSNVIPWDVGRITALGLDAILAAITYGSSKVVLATGQIKFEELHALRGHLEILEAINAGLQLECEAVVFLEGRDPSQLEEKLYQLAEFARNSEQKSRDKGLRIGSKRDRIWLSFNHLTKTAEVPDNPIPLPGGAPFGAVRLDESKCTLCLACVSVCPESALLDNENKPQVSFLEKACVQCGLCRVTCPEAAISLEPQLDLRSAVQQPRVLAEEEPFDCVRCGKPFGVRSSVEKMVDKLREHSMFKGNPGAIDRIRMCEDCRVVDQFSEKQPFAVGSRPITRTSEDYNEDG